MSEKGSQKNGKSSRVKKDARMREVEARSRRGGWIVVTVRDCREKKSKDKKGGLFVGRRQEGRSNREVETAVRRYASAGEEKEKKRKNSLIKV